MNSKNPAIIGALLVAGYYAFKAMGETGNTSPANAGASKTSRGIANNNPGNISRTLDDRWIGLSETQNDGEYLQFKTAEYGLRALAILLLNYQRIHRLSTIRQIITRYGPKGEAHRTNVANYIKFVSRRAGVQPDDIISLSNMKTLMRVMQAIVSFENGSNPYSTATYKAVIAKV